MANAQIRRILVPVDCSSCSRSALEFACNLAKSLDAKVDVLFVEEEAGEAALARAREELRGFVGSTAAAKAASPA